MITSCVLSLEKRARLPKSHYKIIICDLKFLAIVGILEKERITPQQVIADIEIEYVKVDEIFINYAEVANLIEESMKNEKYLLLEEALEDITGKIKLQFSSILSIKLKLLKPSILDNCVVGVEIFKKY